MGGCADSGPSTTTLPESPFFDGEVALVTIGSEELWVAVADTPAERSRGLMEVDDLGELDGMLFVHDGRAVVRYTMENTLIPLDIWFIDDGGTVVGTTEMTPCTTPGDCPLYSSPVAVSVVLETPLGERDFEIGDPVAVDRTP